MKRFLIMFALVAGCAVAHDAPYTSERTLDMFERSTNPLARMPFSRPHAITKTVTLHNPFDRAVEVSVYCPGNIFDGKSNVVITVPGMKDHPKFPKFRGEVHFLVEMNSTDMYDQVCEVTEWHFTELDQ